MSFIKDMENKGKLIRPLLNILRGRKKTILNAKSPNPYLFGLAEALTQDLT